MKDDPEFADAIDCMVSYFYGAGYDASKYDANECLLHAQVAIIAHKYDCASLHNYATTSLANAMKAIQSDKWATVVTFVYDHTTAEVPAHIQLRNVVVASVTNRQSRLKSIVRKEGIESLLRSNADLATDLLLSGTQETEGSRWRIFMCNHCQYAHAGPGDCPYAVPEDNFAVGSKRICPRCGKDPGTRSTRISHVDRVGRFMTFPCYFCDGICTAIGVDGIVATYIDS